MNAHFANIFWRLLQIPAFCLLPSKIRISNSSPLQGRRVNRLPCVFHPKDQAESEATHAHGPSAALKQQGSRMWEVTISIKWQSNYDDIKIELRPSVVQRHIENMQCIPKYAIAGTTMLPHAANRSFWSLLWVAESHLCNGGFFWDAIQVFWGHDCSSSTGSILWSWPATVGCCFVH